jgi:hypothetical protein
LQGQAHEGAEFFDGDELVVGFLEVVFDFVNEVTAIALTFASDALDVFGVNAKANDFRTHDSLFLLNQS